MAFSTIKVRTEDKKDFDRLLHELALRTGETVTHHELFHRILEQALASTGRLVAAGPKAGHRSWKKYQFDLGDPTDAARDVDRTVYGLGR